MRTLYLVIAGQTCLGPTAYSVPRKDPRKALKDLQQSPTGCRLIQYNILNEQDVRDLYEGKSHLLHKVSDCHMCTNL